eukprot:5931128-Pyramimonas_sp.AAC.1
MSSATMARPPPIRARPPPTVPRPSPTMQSNFDADVPVANERWCFDVEARPTRNARGNQRRGSGKKSA